MGFRAEIVAAISGLLSGSPDIGSAKYTFEDSTRLTLSLGSGADQANNVFSDARTLAASATETLDLAGGVSNALGQTLTFSAIKAIKIEADEGNTNTVVVGGGSNPFRGWFTDATDKLSIPPGGVVLLGDPSAAGQPVVAATGDLLLVANGGAGTPVSYTITIVGEA